MSEVDTRDTNIPREFLTRDESLKGCKLLIDTGADTCVAGKHAWVVEVIEGFTANARGFDDSSTTLHNLPIVNVKYALDIPETGETILLEVNHCIYMGAKKADGILCPNQMRLNGVFVDERPTALFPGVQNTQCIIGDDTKIPLQMNGPLMELTVRRPTLGEITNDDIQTIILTSPHGWDPYGDDSISSYNIATVMRNMPLETSSFLSIMPQKVNMLGSTKKRAITIENLMERWGVGKETAKNTLECTWQEYTRSTDNLTRRFKTARVHSRFRHLMGPDSVFYTDTLFFNTKSLRGNTCGQVYFNKCHFYKFYPLKSKRDSHTTLLPLLDVAGLPSQIHSDRAPDLIAGQFSQLLRKYRIRHTTVESNSPWQNRAEGQGVKPVKRLGLWLLTKAGAPARVWDYAFELAADILSLTSRPSLTYGNQPGYQRLTNLKPDISQYASFGFYEWIWHWDETEKVKQLGRWLGVAENVGPIMTFWILNAKGNPIPRSTVIPLLDTELDSNLIQRKMQEFDYNIQAKFNSPNYTIQQDPNIPVINVEESGRTLNETFTTRDLWEGDIQSIPYEPTCEEAAMEQLDEHIGQQVLIKKSDGPVMVKVASRYRDDAGNLVGAKHNQPQLDTRIYNVEFPDGHYERYSANILSEALTESIDSNGYNTSFIKEICGYRVEPIALKRSNGYIQTKSGKMVPRITTKGWTVRVRWDDDSTTWVPMGLLKNAEPIMLAEYAKSMQIHLEPAFRWWVPHTLKKKSRFVSKVKAILHKNNLKFGIEVPRNIKHALQLDKANGNSLWSDAISKEMTNVKIAFRFKGKDESPPVGYKQIRCHLIFDIKMDLTRKARFVAGGHMTDPPTTMTYASVVSRESVRLAFLLASLNELDILTGDIGNAYLNAPTKEKIYYRAGLEWGENMEGSICIIVRALYGLKSSANAWRNHMCATLKEMGFDHSLADNDFWMRKDTKPDGTFYYSYILVYVDDILIVSHAPTVYMDRLSKHYYVKKNSIGPPKLYLGTAYKQVTDRSGKKAWASSTDQYVREATSIVFDRMELMGFKLTKRHKSPEHPFSSETYRPELDLSDPCDSSEHQFFQQTVGIARWMIEIGRIDIAYEISLMSRYLAAPRIGHLTQMLHLFQYLHCNQGMDLTYDSTKIRIQEGSILPHQRAHFKAKELRALYPDAIDYLPPNMPEALGRSVQINAFVDADLAGESTTRRSQTGILIYVNMAPIIWVSKRQNTVESSTFGSEFVAMRSLVELLIGLRYKLRMFGVPIDGPCNVFCDNEPVSNASMCADVTLKRKHISISYHQAREAVAAGIILIFYERSATNHSDLFTKSLSKRKRRELMGLICGK